ncbi:hypothetical protein [Compostimonas suwonensis]|uniref:Uncharacterized protein n=1 Tax=Compostimonas suwonensis TaxID=1048394 RepID=A0A2M9BB68_9MICO|nr:hypothetical protein [Compostimonas suwonensis]PJJ55191.1 hypothetical protein CLV54_3327 [Compostimonas suwonensis]
MSDETRTDESTAGELPGTRAAALAGARASSRRRRWLIASAIAAAVVVVGGSVTVQAYRASAQSEYDVALARFQERQSSATILVDEGEKTLAHAQAVLDDSDGRVLDEQPRTTLAQAVDTASGLVDAANDELSQARAVAASDPDDVFITAGSGYRERTEQLAGFDFDAAAELTALARLLGEPTTSVDTAVAAWQSEQDRILRERYTNDVWTAGWIPELDECRGSVDLTAQYGTPSIAEHWSCGGKNFPDDAGTIITLTGVRAGTYRVEGIVKMLDQSVATTADIPHGYDLLYQTCQNGQSSTMSLTALTKIG